MQLADLPLVFAALFVIAVYIIPSAVALAREVQHAAAIAAVNMFLGWTFIGWVVALVWALTDTRTGQPATKS